MKILIIGSGGREHAIAWKFAQNNKINDIMNIFQNLVTGYKVNLNIVDKIFLEQVKINNGTPFPKTVKSRNDA